MPKIDCFEEDIVYASVVIEFNASLSIYLQAAKFLQMIPAATETRHHCFFLCLLREKMKRGLSAVRGCFDVIARRRLLSTLFPKKLNDVVDVAKFQSLNSDEIKSM